MTVKDLSTTLVLGLLVPLSFMRPAFIDSLSDELHRRQLNFAYSLGAITAVSYAYTVLITYLRPIHHFPLPTARALDLAGIFLVVLVWLQHISLLSSMPTSARRRAAKSLVGAGGFLAGVWLAKFEMRPAGLRSPFGSSVVFVLAVFLVGLVGVRWCCLDPNPEARSWPARVRDRLTGRAPSDEAVAASSIARQPTALTLTDGSQDSAALNADLGSGSEVSARLLAAAQRAARAEAIASAAEQRERELRDKVVAVVNSSGLHAWRLKRELRRQIRA